MASDRTVQTETGNQSPDRIRNLHGVEARRQWPVVRLMSPSRTVVIEEFVPGRKVTAG